LGKKYQIHGAKVEKFDHWWRSTTTNATYKFAMSSVSS